MILDDELRFASFNRKFAEIFGLAGTSATGATPAEITQLGTENRRALAVKWLHETLPELSRGESRSSPIFQVDIPADHHPSSKPRFWSVTASVAALPDSEIILLCASRLRRNQSYSTRIGGQTGEGAVAIARPVRAVLIREAQQKLEES